MPDQTVRVGDVVAWMDVPANALVVTSQRLPEINGFRSIDWYHYRKGDTGWFVGNGPSPLTGHPSWVDIATFGNMWPLWSAWLSHASKTEATVIALNLTGNETADELRAMAERFDIRQALKPWMCEDTMCWGRWFVTLGWPGDIDMAEGWGDTEDAALDMATRRLHDAGWKPTMGPEDAQRLIEANAGRETEAAVAEITAIINHSE